MAGGVMPKMVIEVPEEFAEVGKAMAEHLAALQRTVSRLGGGKAVDYAEIEQAMAESAGRTELAGHRAILQSLDIDVAAVMIGGVRYTRVGRCEAPYQHDGGFGLHREIVVPSIWRAWGAAGRPGSGCGEPAGRRGGGRLAATHGAGDGPCGAARSVAGSGSERARVWPPAVFARQFRAGGACGGGSCRCGSPGH